ncbi:MAG TPA: ABC transporter permease [Acidimicrobiales bacterium]|nr:ABC transporter permease [Acidimicrobiales bacterium]
MARRWRALVAMGVLAGLVGGVVVAAGALLVRTETAERRLERATRAPDAIVQTVDPRDIAPEAVTLPFVTASSVAALPIGLFVGHGTTYVSILTPREARREVFRPIVLEGRDANPYAEDEVVVQEAMARQAGVRVGDRLKFRMLLPEEVLQFDTGFGEPDGPTLAFRVVGIVRASPVLARTPVISTPAFGAAHGEALAGAHEALLRFAPRTTRQDVIRGLDALAATQPARLSDFGPYQATFATDEARPVIATTRVLVGGLLVFAIVAALAGGLAVTQAQVRHHFAGARDQRIESALGLTAGERTLARVLPATIGAAIAAVLAAGVALLGAFAEPPGAIARVDPHPGWDPSPSTIGTGALAVFAGFLLNATDTAGRAGRADRAERARPRPLPIGRIGRTPSLLAGFAFALVPGRGRSTVPVRSSMAGVVLGVAGIVAAATFGASLARLTSAPEHYGWSGDIQIADIQPQSLNRFALDPRFTDVAGIAEAPTRIAGDDVPAYAYTQAKGRIEWTMLDGRAPRRVNEIALGTRTADRLGARVGDSIIVGTGANEQTMEVVGVGLGPSFNAERLGTNVLVTPTALGLISPVNAFTEAVLTVAPGLDINEIRKGIGATFEVGGPTMPAEVKNLSELGRLPQVLAAFLTLVATAGLVHALVVTIRRRGHDLAVLRAIGFTPAQVGRAVRAMATITVLVGFVAGIPLGLALGRLVWSFVAQASGVGRAVVAPIPLLVAVGPAMVLGALAIAALPARRARHAHAAALLRSE